VTTSRRGDWLVGCAQAAEATLKVRPIGRLGPAARLLLGYATLPNTSDGPDKVEFVESYNPLSDVPVPQLRVLTCDGSTTDTSYHQLPLLMMIATDVPIT
jgi:hypothetical protein